MRILIIGGTGILSRAIAMKAIIAGHQVTIVTDGNGDLSEPIGIERHLKVDRNDPVALQQAFATTGVESWDLVVDAICYNPHQAAHLIPLIADKSKHTIIISTAILYDPSISRPLQPNDNLATDLELGKYGRKKVKMERVWLDAYHQQSHPVTILRPPHILGAGAELGIIPLHNRDRQLINRLKNHQPLLLTDRGEQKLQVVFSEDIADVILASAGKPQTFGQIYNCANPDVITAYEYFATIAELLGVELRVKNIAKESVWQSNWGWIITTVSRVLDMSSLERDVGLIPRTSIKKALNVTLDYLLSNSVDRDSPDLSLVELEYGLEHGESLDRLLSDTARHRERLPIDLRMNIDPPIYSIQNQINMMRVAR